MSDIGHFGRDDLMAIAAVRYCIGRSTYIVGDCVDWMIQHWSKWSPNCRAVIARDLNAEFKRDDEARSAATSTSRSDGTATAESGNVQGR